MSLQIPCLHIPYAKAAASLYSTCWQASQRQPSVKKDLLSSPYCTTHGGPLMTCAREIVT